TFHEKSGASLDLAGYLPDLADFAQFVHRHSGETLPGNVYPHAGCARAAEESIARAGDYFEDRGKAAAGGRHPQVAGADRWNPSNQYTYTAGAYGRSKAGHRNSRAGRVRMRMGQAQMRNAEYGGRHAWHQFVQRRSEQRKACVEQ